MKNMREYNKKVNAKMFLSFLAIAFALGAGSNAAMAGVPEQRAVVSENDPDTENHKETGVSLKETETFGETEAGQKIGTEGEDPLETYNGIPTEWLPENEEYVYDPESGNYLTQDAFYKAATKKGIQGDFNGASYKASYDSRHTLININVTDFMGDGHHPLDKRFDYRGRTYWFRDDKSPLIQDVNAKGGTISIVILVPLIKNKEILVDPAALSNRDKNGESPYYAPNIRGEGRHYYEAMFAWMAENWCLESCHVDNFILGNEVNMPNQWNFTGTADPQYNAELYAEEYLMLYNAVRAKTSACRVSVSVDHSWQHDNMGTGIGVRDFLERFHACLGARQGNVDWTVSCHLYPALLYEPDIWAEKGYVIALKLNPKNSAAQFVDGYNLSVMTDYIRDNFGPHHRVMLTEQGFSDVFGQEVQAASLALSYYAAKYDPMVDCFIIHEENEKPGQNFYIAGKLAQTVYEKADSDPAWVEAHTLPVIGTGSYGQLVPYYGRNMNRAGLEGYVDRLYQLCLNRKPDPAGQADWIDRLYRGRATGAQAAFGFFFSDEFKLWNTTDEEYVELLYNVMMGRASDTAGKADWVYKLHNGVGREGVFRGFTQSREFEMICASYGIEQGTVSVSEARDKNFGLTTFIARLYTRALGRTYETAGLNDWCGRILAGSWTVYDVSTKGFFHSKEFYNRNLSDDQYVKVLYRTFLDREYDRAGYDYWMSRLAAGASRDEVLAGFSNSREFAELMKSYGL